jgi:transcriptional regulator with XRE-family HTH domain
MGITLNGELVHARRCAAGLTVAALADRVGVHTDVIWAIEHGDGRTIENLPVLTLVSLANSLDLHPSQLFADTEAASPRSLAPDDVVLEAALLEHGASITRDDLAIVFGWPLARIECVLAALHQRLASTGARLHPVGVDTYTIAPNRRAANVDQWVQLGQSRSAHAPLTPDAARALYKLFAWQASLTYTAAQRRSASTAFRTDDWDDTREDLRQLREQQLLDQTGLYVRPSPDVYFSLGLTD